MFLTDQITSPCCVDGCICADTLIVSSTRNSVSSFGVMTVIPVMHPYMVITFSPYTPVPSPAVALTVTVPFERAERTPACVIWALPVPGMTDHTTFLTSALLGVIEATICSVLPCSRRSAGADTVIPVTGVFSTWMSFSAEWPLFAVALTVTVPTERPVSKPFCVMEACPVPGMTDHVTDRPARTENCSVWFMRT